MMASKTSDNTSLYRNTPFETSSSADNEDVEPEILSDDYALNVLLLGIAKNITDEELKDMKMLCSGNSISYQSLKIIDFAFLLTI